MIDTSCRRRYCISLFQNFMLLRYWMLSGVSVKRFVRAANVGKRLGDLVPTCKSEHDELLRIAAGTDVRLVGVNYKDDSALARNWLSQFGNPYELVIVDADGALGVELGVYGAPETFLLDRSGR